MHDQANLSGTPCVTKGRSSRRSSAPMGSGSSRRPGTRRRGSGMRARVMLSATPSFTKSLSTRRSSVPMASDCYRVLWRGADLGRAIGSSSRRPPAPPRVGRLGEFSPDGRGSSRRPETRRRGSGMRARVKLSEPLASRRLGPRGKLQPRRERIVTASVDRTARIWDARSSRAIGEALLHEGAVVSAQFSPDGLGSSRRPRMGQRGSGMRDRVRLSASPYVTKGRRLGPVQPRWAADPHGGVGQDGADLGCAIGSSCRPASRRLGRVGTLQPRWKTAGHGSIGARIWDSPTGVPQDSETLVRLARLLAEQR